MKSSKMSKKYCTEEFYIPGASELMPLETPLLRVSRPVAACQRCRTAKIKCDGKLPACTACEKSGRAKQCSSTNNQFAPGKERSYVATLESKIEKLQKRIDEAKKRRKSSLSMLEFASPTTPLSRSSTFDSNEKPRDRRLRFKQELTCIDELVSDFGFLTVNATARDLTYNFTHSISYARLILAASTKEALPSGLVKELTSQTTTEDTALITLFIDHLCPILPIMEESDIWRSWHSVSSRDTNTTAMEYWTTRLVLAISSAMQSQQRGDAKYFDACGHVNAALEVADQVLHPGSIYSIQAMLLLVQYSMLDPSHFDSWTLIGAASRAMIDLGLHQDPSKSANVRRDKLELRRRVYHCVYALDRSTSIVQMRALSFSDDSAKVGLPFQKKPQSPSPVSGISKANMWTRTYDVSLAFLRLRQIQSSWYTQLFQSSREPLDQPYQYIWQIYQEMTDWHNSIPASTTPVLNQFFELELLYSYVYILSPNSACPRPSEHAQRLIIQHCIKYAEMVQGIQCIPPTDKHPSPFSFYDALRVYMMGRVFVDTISSNIDLLFVPAPHTPTYLSASSFEDIDPRSSAPTSMPSLPTPEPTDSSLLVAKSIETIEKYLSILNALGIRFGVVSGISWHNKFQSEASPVLTQLRQRLHSQSTSPQDSSSYFWATSSGGGLPVTPTAQVGILGTSPGSHRSASFYPSPPATQYSPGHIKPEPQADLTAPWYSGNELGVDHMAAWKTLPGGPMNPRFS